MRPGEDRKDMKDAEELFSRLNIRRINLHMQIADRIQELIAEENLQPGTRLPAERNLAEQLKVNRNTLREAIRLLEQRGLVMMKPGMGTFVAGVPIHTVTESLIRYATFGHGARGDLLVLREIIEPEMAALAAAHATEEESAFLQERLKALDQAVERQDVDAYVRADESFHEAIAEASHNELIRGIIKGLRSYMLDLRLHIIVELREEDRRANRSVFEAIRDRDPDAAREAMRRHMTFARRVFEAAEKRRDEGSSQPGPAGSR